MTDYRCVAPGPNIGAVEFGGEGKTRTITVAAVDATVLPDMSGREKKEFRVAIKGTDRYWIVNKTNQQSLAAMFGNDVEAWVGRRVVLVAEANTKSESGLAIRVYGSPDIAADVEAVIRLPRKTPVKRLLRRVEKQQGRESGT